MFGMTFDILTAQHFLHSQCQLVMSNSNILTMWNVQQKQQIERVVSFQCFKAVHGCCWVCSSRASGVDKMFLFGDCVSQKSQSPISAHDNFFHHALPTLGNKISWHLNLWILQCPFGAAQFWKCWKHVDHHVSSIFVNEWTRFRNHSFVDIHGAIQVLSFSEFAMPADWEFGSPAVWQCSSVAVWRSGGMAVWQRGSLAV